MRPSDVATYALRALFAQPGRCSLLLLAMAVGVASVVLLTSLGEGARAYVLREFESLGTNLLIVLPGRSETKGGAPPILAETPRDLTLDDALALLRHGGVRRVAPIVVGVAAVSWESRERECTIIGSTREFLDVRKLELGRGRFLPPGDPRRASPVCVLGAQIADELFRDRTPIGRQIRVGDRRFRVVGLLRPGGESLGVDLGEMVVIPVASAQMLFDTESLFRVIVEARSRDELAAVERHVASTIRRRHDGEDDVTVIRQDSVLGTFDTILRVLTLTVGGVASISLVVAGILIMNVMLVSVAQRTAEIGLLKALGAPRRDILALFLAEAACLSGLGGTLGLAIAAAAIGAVRAVWPSFPLAVPAWAIASALLVAVATGCVFGLLPARRAARLDPVLALARH